jgi:hypothetical protein
MAKLKKNRKLTPKELAIVLQKLGVVLPVKQTGDTLFTALDEEIKKPPFPPPPGKPE